MKAILTDGRGRVYCSEVPEPQLGPFDCRVRMDSCLFCNSTDRHIVDGTFDFGLSYPCILGHESIGEVVEVGDRVRHFRPGDRVIRPYAVYPDERLGTIASGWGGFAEFGKIRDFRAQVETGEFSAEPVPGFYRYMQKIPEDVPREEALMITCLREIYSSTQKIPEVAGKSFLIAGAGVAGLLFACFLHRRGAERIVMTARRASAREFAMRETPVAAACPMENLGRERFDAVVDTTGSPEVVHHLSRHHLCGGGSLMSYAIYPDQAEAAFASYLPQGGRFVRIDPQEATAHDAICSLLARGELKTAHWISSRFSATEANAAWQNVLNRESLKTAVIFS